MPKKNFSYVEDYLKWFVARLPEIRCKVNIGERPEYFSLKFGWMRSRVGGERGWCCGYTYEESHEGTYWEDGLSAGHTDPLEALRILKERVEEFLAK